ncbi:hypothetical protein ACFLSJ_02430 [Verrucomicrobiota bacterium]
MSALLLPGFSSAEQFKADYRQSTKGVLDGCGGVCSNSNCKTFVAAFQPCPVGANASTTHRNYSGFLNSFVMRPDLDYDGDGICDENDSDDDNDGYADLTELPAGMNPTNSSLLRILAFDRAGGTNMVLALALKGKTYELLCCHVVPTNPPTPWPFDWTCVATVTVEAATGRWLETEYRWDHTTDTFPAFYRLKQTNEEARTVHIY